MTARNLFLLPALGFASVLLFGCGGDGSTQSADPHTDAAGSPRPATVPDQITMREAVELAEAVNLRAADVPYFEERPKEPDSDEDEERDRRLEDELGRCLGGLDLSAHMLKYESPAYGSPAPGEVLTVQSSVEVVASAGVARRRAGAYRSGHGQKCFRRLVLPALGEEGSNEVAMGKATVTRLSPPMPDVDGGVFGYRVSTTAILTGAESQLTGHRPGTEVATSRHSIPLYADFLGFTVGPAEVNLVAIGAPAPVSKNLERNLLAMLHERALANLR